MVVIIMTPSTHGTIYVFYLFALLLNQIVLIVCNATINHFSENYIKYFHISSPMLYLTKQECTFLNSLREIGIFSPESKVISLFDRKTM